MTVGREFPAELIPAGIIRPAAPQSGRQACPVPASPGCHCLQQGEAWLGALVTDEAVLLAPRLLVWACCALFVT